MDSQHLQNRLKEIQGHIDDFKETLANSESQYQMSLKLINDPALRSSLMENHVVHTERQREAIAKMEKLYGQAQDHLKNLDKSNP